MADNRNRSSVSIFRLIKSEKILVPSRPVIRTAEDILSERYSKGELIREQYMQMKKT